MRTLLTHQACLELYRRSHSIPCDTKSCVLCEFVKVSSGAYRASAGVDCDAASQRSTDDKFGEAREARKLLAINEPAGQMAM